MSDLRSDYYGMDTFFVHQRSDFSMCSFIGQKNDAVYLHERPDLRQHLSDLVTNGCIPSSIGQRMLEDSDILFGDIDVRARVQSAAQGGTYVSLSDCIKLDEAMRTASLSTCVVPRTVFHSFTRNNATGGPLNGSNISNSNNMNNSNAGNGGNVANNGAVGLDIEVQYLPPWPKYLIRVHPFDEHGAEIPFLGTFFIRRSNLFDSQIAWCMASIATTVPLVWEKLSVSVSNYNDWQGWFLSFVSTKCLGWGRKIVGKRSIFTTKSLKDIVYLLHNQHDVEGYSPDRIGYLHGQFESIHIFMGARGQLGKVLPIVMLLFEFGLTVPMIFLLMNIYPFLGMICIMNYALFAQQVL